MPSCVLQAWWYTNSPGLPPQVCLPRQARAWAPAESCLDFLSVGGGTSSWNTGLRMKKREKNRKCWAEEFLSRGCTFCSSRLLSAVASCSGLFPLWRHRLGSPDLRSEVPHRPSGALRVPVCPVCRVPCASVPDDPVGWVICGPNGEGLCRWVSVSLSVTPGASAGEASCLQPVRSPMGAS